jgi:sigma-B regulation protein RsbU (phosphoserine phosphatase)
MFVTVWVGILEISTGKMTCANAGHEYPVMYTKEDSREFELIKDRHGFVVGGMEHTRYREYELQMKPGDKLFVYTDGLPEATDADGQMFTTEKMVETLNTVAQGSPKEVLRTVKDAVNAFVGDAEQFDDLTMLCLEYRGTEGKGNE